MKKPPEGGWLAGQRWASDANFFQDRWKELRQEEGSNHPHDDLILGLRHRRFDAINGSHVSLHVLELRLHPHQPVAGITREVFKSFDSGFHVSIIWGFAPIFQLPCFDPCHGGFQGFDGDFAN